MYRIPPRILLVFGVPLATLAVAFALAAVPADDAVAARSARAAVAVDVAIVAPTTRARVRGTVRVTAVASARRGVARVEFRVDGALRWTARSAPYVLNGPRGRLSTLALANGRHMISATAYDRKGRRARATRAVVVVNPTHPAPAAPEGPTSDPLGPAVPGPPGLDRGPGTGAPVSPAPAPAPPPAAEPPPAPVAPSVFLSPAGNDAANCSAGAPCRSLDRGYRVAAPGAVVQLAGGSYPGGTIGYDPAKAGAGGRVAAVPAPGQAVTIADELRIDAQHLELRDMALAGGWQTEAGAIDVVMRNLDSRHLFINSSQQVSVIGGRVGPGQDYHPQIQSSTTTPPRDILVDGVTFHDWSASNSSVHTECLQIGSGDRITVRNSRFINCHATGNMHITHYGDAPRTRNVTIENNFFSSTVNGFYALQAYAVSNLLIRNNSATQGILVMPFPGDSVGANNVRLVANLAPMASYECVAGVTYRSNVWYRSGAGQAARCHSSDTALSGTSNPGFVDPGALDLHLSASSPALGRGAATEAAVTDIDGEPRGTASDAGADER